MRQQMIELTEAWQHMYVLDSLVICGLDNGFTTVN